MRRPLPVLPTGNRPVSSGACSGRGRKTRPLISGRVNVTDGLFVGLSENRIPEIIARMVVAPDYFRQDNLDFLGDMK